MFENLEQQPRSAIDSAEREPQSLFESLLVNAMSEERKASFEGFTSDSPKHRGHPPNNEIYFLAQDGDKILDDYYLALFKSKKIHLNERRGLAAKLASNKNLAKVADKIGIDVFYSHVENPFTVHRKGTVMEALVAAIYEKSGAENFPRVFAPLSDLIMESAGIDVDDKSEEVRSS
jgi:dsRNA-specific ribonuclease